MIKKTTKMNPGFIPVGIIRAMKNKLYADNRAAEILKNNILKWTKGFRLLKGL